MKILGLLAAFIGIVIVGSALVFTKANTYNVVDSNSSLNASAAIFFGGLIVFGAGVVTYAIAVAPKKAKN